MGKVYKLVPIIGTIMESKEEKVLELFFNNPTRQWHFEEIVKEADLARSKADNWLKRFIGSKLIKKVKKKGSMPYYISMHNSPAYRNRKRLFASNRLYESGLLNHLSSLKIHSAIIFGSYSRSDWYEESDIDVFIFGNPDGLKIAKYEQKLKRNIQLFIFRNAKELSRMGEGLIRNVLKGNLIAGNLDFLKVDINA